MEGTINLKKERFQNKCNYGQQMLNTRAQDCEGKSTKGFGTDKLDLTPFM